MRVVALHRRLYPARASRPGHPARIGEDYLAGRYRITVIDVLHDPKGALREGNVALPTLAWTGPGWRVTGDLADRGRVMVGLVSQAC